MLNIDGIVNVVNYDIDVLTLLLCHRIDLPLFVGFPERNDYDAFDHMSFLGLEAMERKAGYSRAIT